MKNTIKTFAIILATTFIISCDNNDDAQTTPATPTDGFTAAGVFYPTPNCYIEFDEDFDPNLDEFNLFFTNGRMHDNTSYPGTPPVTDDYLFSLNTTNWVFINVRELENPSITNPSYPNIQTGIAYIGGDTDSVIINNGIIDDIGFISNGINFGQGNDSVVPIAQNGNPVMTINNYTYDIQAQTGNINVDYNYNGIIGHYEGTFGIILD